jgi:peroxiredoxin (alkyl hydroperoxide reductase subunit C)
MEKTMTVLVGHKAPDFVAPAVLADGRIVDTFTRSKETANHHSVLFFYPLDFTFVCPTELVELSKQIDEFEAINTKVIAISIDSQFTHNAWRQTSPQDGGVGPVKFPMVADIDHSISHMFGIEHPEARVSMRATFIIDKDGIVQHQAVNNLPLGRNISEIKRLVQALQFHETHGEVCPVNWQKGQSGMKTTHEGVKDYLKEHA